MTSSNSKLVLAYANVKGNLFPMAVSPIPSLNALKYLGTAEEGGYLPEADEDLKFWHDSCMAALAEIPAGEKDRLFDSAGGTAADLPWYAVFEYGFEAEKPKQLWAGRFFWLSRLESSVLTGPAVFCVEEDHSPADDPHSTDPEVAVPVIYTKRAHRSVIFNSRDDAGGGDAGRKEQGCGVDGYPRKNW